MGALPSVVQSMISKGLEKGAEVNPLKPASTGPCVTGTEDTCDGPSVFYRDIVRSYGKVVEKIIRLIVRSVRVMVFAMISIGTFIFSFLVSLIPLTPGFIFMYAAATLLAVLWDIVTKPIIIIFIKAYNGAAGAWNDFTDMIRFIGINERFFGVRIKFKLFGFDLPRAPIASTNLPGFWEFVYEKLTPDVIKREVLSKIFRPKGYIPPPREENCLTKI